MTNLANRRYPATVFWDDDDQGFIATAPDLPGCSAFGETEAKALAELKHAIQAWIEAAQQAGNPIPQPSRPADQNYSGKVLLRMPRSLHAELADGAKSDNVSLNQHIVVALTMATAYRKSSNLMHFGFADFGRLLMTEMHMSNPLHMQTFATERLVIGAEPKVQKLTALALPSAFPTLSHHGAR